jgi:hypothetical protein
MASTYEPIATLDISGLGTYTFNSISGSYTDLILIQNNFSSGAVNGFIQVNGDTGNYYSGTNLNGNGSSATSNRDSNTSRWLYSQVGAQQASPMIVHFMNYSNTSTYKTALGRIGSQYGTQTSVWLYQKTNAITSITVTCQTTNFGTGSATLFGIKAA